MHRFNPTVIRGATAGLLAALALALWFLVIDVIQGTPFYTPAFVASSLIGLGDVQATVPLLAMYTALHFAVFILIGIGVSWVLSRTDTAPHFLLGFVLGFLLFDLVFYAGVIATGVNVVSALGWPAVLVGNLLAGLVLMGTLAKLNGGRFSIREVLNEHQTVREGLVAGLIGAVAVALWFLALDVVRGQIFFTPAALGSALFFGARGVAEVQVTVGTVLGYTALHLAAFLAVGFLASALATAAEREPPVLLGLSLLFVTFEALFLGLLAIVAGWLLDALDWWSVVVANLVAAAAMGAFLWHEHPRLQEELGHDIEEELVQVE
ncbi:MAG: hypothetical protein ACRELX_12125 [Longimicrobiales bacterium]